MADDIEDTIQADFDWAKNQMDEPLPPDAEEHLEQEFLEAVNSLQEEGMTEEESEEAFRTMVRNLQVTAYLAGYSLGVRVTPNDGAESVVAVINSDDATALIKAMITNQEIPLTIRVIGD
jgi:hypothetical protein